MHPEPHAHTPPGIYDLYPTFPIPAGQILVGYEPLARILADAVENGARLIAIDGFGGTLWSELRDGLETELARLSVQVEWRDTASCFLPENVILERIADNLGGNDPIFGRLCERPLSDFFDLDQLHALAAPADDRPVIVFGVGATLVGAADVLLYVDVPKDEIQRRISAQSITNLGARSPAPPQAMYKRCFFVDWQVLNRHKADVLPHVDWFIDGQNAGRPTAISGNGLRAALQRVSESCFRVRPWFAPGPWGGQWMKQHIEGIQQDVPNLAWSFELIVPENGLVFESGDDRLECSLDLLMYQHHREVLGNAAERFGYDFPIRFDYLDTFDGGNLSIQTHPRPEYIRKHFGEPFTQDESYYITTCQPGAHVYLGFRDGVDPAEFRAEVERSQREQTTIDIDRFVYRADAHPHDIFLIPNGTIHGSGVDNLVLEISATPYIYTFKIYDWMRRDLHGNLRPLNIERAWQNLYFDRQEAYVDQYLCPKPSVIREGDGWREVVVGTHDELFYAVHRYEFERDVEASTDGRCHMLNVVEGQGVVLETANGYRARFNFAETFVIPAAAKGYRLSPIGGEPCKVVLAFVK